MGRPLLCALQGTWPPLPHACLPLPGPFPTLRTHLGSFLAEQLLCFRAVDGTGQGARGSALLLNDPFQPTCPIIKRDRGVEPALRGCGWMSREAAWSEWTVPWVIGSHCAISV